jgi:hypothetical protein
MTRARWRFLPGRPRKSSLFHEYDTAVFASGPALDLRCWSGPERASGRAVVPAWSQLRALWVRLEEDQESEKAHLHGQIPKR